MPKTIDTLRRMLNAKAPTRPGFSGALAAVLDLAALGLTEKAFDASPGSFAKTVRAALTVSPLQTLLTRRNDGVEIALRRTNTMGFFGRSTGSKITPLTAGARYRLAVAISDTRHATQGHLCILSFGYAQRRWQLVSAVAEPAVPPTRVIPWGQHTGILFTAGDAIGRFKFFVVGSSNPFPTAVLDIFNKCLVRIDTGAFLSALEVAKLHRVLEPLLRTAWASHLDYAVQV